MRKILSFAFIMLVCSPVYAWHYQRCSNGYYTRINDYGVNDGCYYTYRCGCYYYYQAIPVNTTVNYNYNWKDDIVKALDRKNDNNQFLETLRESGLMTPQQSAAYNQNLNGISVLTQGLFGQGSTIYGSIPSSPQQIDWQSYQQNQLQFQNRALDAATASNNGVNINVKAANDLNTDLAKYQTAIDGIVKTAVATVTPKQLVTTTTVTSGSNGSYQQVPPQPNPGNTVSALALTRGEVVINNVCAKCHSGADPKGKNPFVDLLANMPGDDRDSLACSAMVHMNSKNPDVIMPPLSTGVKLTSDDKVGVFDFIRGN